MMTMFTQDEDHFSCLEVITNDGDDDDGVHSQCLVFTYDDDGSQDALFISFA